MNRRILIIVCLGVIIEWSGVAAVDNPLITQTDGNSTFTSTAVTNSSQTESSASPESTTTSSSSSTPTDDGATIAVERTDAPSRSTITESEDGKIDGTPTVTDGRSVIPTDQTTIVEEFYTPPSIESVCPSTTDALSTEPPPIALPETIDITCQDLLLFNRTVPSDDNGTFSSSSLLDAIAAESQWAGLWPGNLSTACIPPWLACDSKRVGGATTVANGNVGQTSTAGSIVGMEKAATVYHAPPPKSTHCDNAFACNSKLIMISGYAGGAILVLAIGLGYVCIRR